MQTTLLSAAKATNTIDKSEATQESSQKDSIGFENELQKEIEKTNVATNEVKNGSEKQISIDEKGPIADKESSVETDVQEASLEINDQEIQEIEGTRDENVDSSEIDELDPNAEELPNDENKVEDPENLKKKEVSAVIGLLQKIENAKNIDTDLNKVSGKEIAPSEVSNHKDQKSSLGEKDSSYDLNKMIASGETVKKEEGKFELKNNLSNSDPINHAIKNFSEHLPASDKSELAASSFISANNTSSANLENINKSASQLQSQAQLSKALEQPLELHSKHASALLGEKVLLMMKKGTHEVQIRLDPAELGSMMIKMQMVDDKMQLTIQTQVGQARDLIEQNLPRLREQLAGQGVTLGEANIEQQAKHQNRDQNNQSERNINSDLNNRESEENRDEFTQHSVHLPSSSNMIDFYA